MCVTFTINFVQCYWMMYRVTFAKSRLSGVLPTARFAAGGKRDTRAVAGSDDGLTKDSPELVGILAKGAVFY